MRALEIAEDTYPTKIRTNPRDSLPLWRGIQFKSPQFKQIPFAGKFVPVHFTIAISPQVTRLSLRRLKSPILPFPSLLARMTRPLLSLYVLLFKRRLFSALSRLAG